MGSKDTTPRQIKAVYDHLLEDAPFTSFTIGINDDVTNLSLKEDPEFNVDADYTGMSILWFRFRWYCFS